MEQKKQTQIHNEHQTIVALCTPRGSGALGIIRLSGPEALSITSAFAKLSSKELLCNQSSHTIHHGYVVDVANNNELVDEVLFMIMKGPKTFTGEDTVEINCHNNPFIINNIIACSIYHGAREAKQGEFTKRAYLNGKIDLLQAEAIREIIHAPSEQALKASLAQRKGSLSSVIVDIEQDLLSLLTLTEASFEFLEEEQQDITLNNMIQEKIQKLQNFITELKATFDKQHVIKDGIRIALIGNVNAGKSTLFNTLAKKNRAITSDKEGTTRDSIEYSIVYEGMFWQLIDTAGLRKTDDVIEQLGIVRSHEEAKMADIVLLIFDASKSLESDEMEVYKNLYATYKNKLIIVLNKADLQQNIAVASLFPNNTTVPIITISALEVSGITQLQSAIQEKITTLFQNSSSPYLLNQRHIRLLSELQNKIENIANRYLDSLEYELIAYSLREILEHIAEMTGKQTSEQILSTVFSTFCIGK